MEYQSKFTQLWPGGPSYTAGDSFPLSTDAILLASFVAPRKHCVIADFGCGSGILGLLIKCKEPSVRLMNIDIQNSSLETARLNMQKNEMETDVTYHCADFQDLHDIIPSHRLDLIVCNPPYFSTGSGETSPEKARKVARSETNFSLDSLMHSAADSLRSGGQICLVHRPERMVELTSAMTRYHIEPKRIRFVQHSVLHKASLVLIEGRYDGNPGLKVEPVLILHEQDGTMTQEAKLIYHQI